MAAFAEPSAAPGFAFVIEPFGGRPTCSDDGLDKPDCAITRPASRVETPHTYLPATASVTARHERRPTQRTSVQRLGIVRLIGPGGLGHRRVERAGRRVDRLGFAAIGMAASLGDTFVMAGRQEPLALQAHGQSHEHDDDPGRGFLRRGAVRRRWQSANRFYSPALGVPSWLAEYPIRSNRPLPPRGAATGSPCSQTTPVPRQPLFPDSPCSQTTPVPRQPLLPDNPCSQTAPAPRQPLLPDSQADLPTSGYTSRCDGSGQLRRRARHRREPAHPGSLLPVPPRCPAAPPARPTPTGWRTTAAVPPAPLGSCSERRCAQRPKRGTGDPAHRPRARDVGKTATAHKPGTARPGGRRCEIALAAAGAWAERPGPGPMIAGGRVVADPGSGVGEAAVQRPDGGGAGRGGGGAARPQGQR